MKRRTIGESTGIVLVSMAALLLLALLLGEKAHVLPLGTITSFDKELARMFASVRTPALTSLFLLITQFGSTSVALVIATIAAFFFRVRLVSYFLPFLLTVIGNSATVGFIKSFIARPRPAFDLAFYIEDWYSFPSGHSAIAVALYGFLAYVLVRSVQQAWLKALIGIVAALFILLIGMSRLYLDFHYLSDVAGGFIVGGIWLAIGVLVHSRRVR